MKISALYIMILIFLILTTLTGCSAKASAKTSISGEIKGLRAGTLQLILEEDINRKKSRLVTSISVDASGRFRLEQELTPHIYTLKVNEQRSVMLAIDSGQQIVVSGDVNGPQSWQVTGSEDTLKLQAYERFRKESLDQLVNSVRNRIKELKNAAVPDTDPRQVELASLEIENYVKHKDELIRFIDREMGTSLAIYPTSIRWDGEKNVPFLRDLSKRFQAAHPGTEIAAKLIEKVEVIAANSIGGTVAEISMADRNGVVVPLSSIKGKFILIDFWGSWCAPCRGESRLLSELFQKYNRKGFEIYGVGLESSREPWLKAIEQDKRVWTNVSSFQEFETPVAFDYAFTALPANVLIDGTGKVVARNLHGKTLAATIDKLFSPAADISR